MTSKQRAYLMGIAQSESAIFQIGKSGISPEMSTAISDALEARELIKISVLKNCFDDPKELGRTLADRTRSQLVQVIGREIVLYRESKTHKKIELPK